jgi:hypothetical protein
MSSEERDRKRSGLAGQIEVEIIRDQYSSDESPIYASSTNPISILQQLVEQAEELEQTSSDARLELLSRAQMQQQLARFQKQNSVLKQLLNKMH